VNRLIVALNGIQTGELQLEPSGAMAFQYSKDWLDRPGARPISLSLPLSAQRYRGALVYNFFDNLLPDSDAIRGRMQARFKIPTSHPFDLLSRIGRDCVGAIQLYPSDSSVPSINAVKAEPLHESDIETILKNHQNNPMGMTEDDEFRISLAGAQEKTALLWFKNQWHRPLGSTPTSHILKLPIGFIGQSNIDLRESTENEWLCLEIARAYGLPVAHSSIGQFGAEKALIVERFDRRWSKDKTWLTRLPQEDFCQALGIAPALKYESDGGPGIREGMQLLLGSQQAGLDRDNFFQAQILFWLLAAIDGHAKNYSVFLEADSAYRMAPLYDVISAYPLIARGNIPAQKARMAMSLKGRNRHYHWARIQPRHFLSTAQQVGFSTKKASTLMQEMALQTEPVIRQVQSILPKNFPCHISQPVFEGLRKQARKLG
jgi:serine/threonine-protein kinase HipA